MLTIRAHPYVSHCGDRKETNCADDPSNRHQRQGLERLRHEKFFDTKTPGFGIRVGVKTKTWVVMRGRNRELVTIGKYPELSLADARTEAKGFYRPHLNRRQSQRRGRSPATSSLPKTTLRHTSFLIAYLTMLLASQQTKYRVRRARGFH